MLRVLVEGIRMSAKRFVGVWGLKHVGLILGIVAAGFASTGISEPIPSAANRVFLGDAQGITLAASTNQDTVQTINVLRQQAASYGATRVIVGVRAAFAPEGLMAAGSVALQRNEIAATQMAVLNKIASLKKKPETTKRFESIPFMALEATPAELEALVSQPEITSIEEDRLAEPTLAQSVPLIGGATAWSSGYTGAGRAIAILDTGVEKTHPFLAGKVVSEACYSTNYASQGATSVCPGGVMQSTAAGSAMPYASGVCPAGRCDHGTHVAGIAAGKGTSYSGVAKDASLIAIQVFSRFNSVADCGSATPPCVRTYQSDQILGLQRVYVLRTTYNIAAVNMSLGGGRYYSTCDATNTSTKAAIDTLRSANIATVISSGNDGYTNSMGAPGCISTAISVGATWDAAGVANNCAGNNLGYSTVNQIACYSNSASFLNLLAPGSLITSSIPYGMYSNYQGTSMAAPHVAGAWALLKQKKAALTVTEGLNALSSTGVPVTDSRNGIVKRRIQVNAALNAIASGCTYTLSSTGLSAGAAAAIGNVSVTTTTGCAWTTVSNAAWITVTSGASRSGSGSVGYSIAANTGASLRTGTLTIAGKTFTVTQNGAGTLPAAPTIGVATAGNASARVVFTPGAIGSGTLRYYTAMCGNITATGTSSPIMVLGLTNGTVYTCKVRTSSSVGIGPWSALRSVTPSASLALPAAPTIGVATAGNASARVSFTPRAIGSGTLLNYTAMCGSRAASGTGSPITVSGLTNGTAYTCKVRTTSTVGAGIWSAFSNTVTPSTSAAAASRLNDTGITASQCYQAGGYTLVACNSAEALALNNAQDGMKGRDANAASNGNTDGKLGFSFTSVVGGCVRDNVTGLMWEVKTADGGLRDWNKTYTDYDSTTALQKWNGSTYVAPTQAEIDAATNSVGFRNSVNAQGLCGHSDWRLPTADELQGIVDYGVGWPDTTIDATWFPNTKNSWGSWFWSSSPNAGSSIHAWGVNFGDGYAYPNYRGFSNYVRLVRAGQPSAIPRYTVSANGQEVTDNQTKLIWRRCAEGMSWNGTTCAGFPGVFTHEAALQRAAAQVGSTGVAWRLPDIKELSSIVDRSRRAPAIDPTAFPAAPPAIFWSSSPSTGYHTTAYNSIAWVVQFYDGNIERTYDRSVSLVVRLVRTGQ